MPGDARLAGQPNKSRRGVRGLVQRFLSRALPGKTAIARAIAHALLLGAFLPFAASAEPADSPEDEAKIEQAKAETAEAESQGKPAQLDEVVVSARKREELITDIPVSVSSVSAGTMDRQGLRSVADIAKYVPGLNINSDSISRAFVSIRGIGTALQAGVQPGVGVFQDGIYVRETSYINNPLLDIDHIEVLRGPQGTLYGKNTLGGAINIITRQPTDEFGGRVYGNYSEGDDNAEFGGSVGGGISDSFRARISFATRDGDGWYDNELTGDDAGEFSSDQANLATVWDISETAQLTGNVYYLNFEGPGTAYSAVNSETDYRYNLQVNVSPRQEFDYTGANVKLTMPIFGNTDFTAIAAFDSRETNAVADGDFLPLDIVRTAADEDNDTTTAELRFDTLHSDTFSTLFGLFASHETVEVASAQTVVPAARTVTTFADRTGDTWALFGTAIWKFAPDWEFTAGLRYDDEDRDQDLALVSSAAPGTTVPLPSQSIGSEEWQPRVSLTHFFPDTGWMMYGSVARGYRGGGFNSTSAPPQFLTYDGDSVWTYELGGKFASLDGRTQFTTALFYNDYSDFIGQNALAQGPGGGLVSVDLNLGDVESYGVEAEVIHQMSDNWTLSGNAAWVHARITDQSGWIELVGRPLPSDRLLFQPDHTYGVASDVRWPVGEGSIDWNINAQYKGTRPASTFASEATILESYTLVNTSLTWRHKDLSVGVYANNLFDTEYFESYIDGSLLASLGLLDQNLGLLGNGRNAGIRLEYRF